MRIPAIIHGTEQIVCELIIVPYGLYVIQNGKRDYEWEQILITRSRQMLTDEVLEELKDYGKERPEGYIYYYACVKHFRLSTDNIFVEYPGSSFLTLFPEDFTFKRLDILENNYFGGKLCGED